MYLKGTIEIDLTGTEVRLRPPSGFFRGVGNLMTGGRWSTREEHETYKLLALTQAAHRVLGDLGVNDVIRIAVGPTVIYEDFNQRPDDFEPAMEELRRRIEMDGLELGSQGEFDLLLAHDDGLLKKTIDLDFHRDHQPGEWPLAIRVTAIPAELRRQPDETDEAFEARLRGVLADQAEYDRFHDRLETRLRAFLDEIVAGLRGRLGIENVRVSVQTEIMRAGYSDGYTAFGGPFYGYDPTLDLAYLWLWSDLMGTGWHQREYADGGFGGWADSSPTGIFAPAGETWREPVGTSSSGGGADLQPGASTSSSGGGADLQPSATASDSGGGADLQGAATEHGGGWLSSIADFFSGSSGDSSGSDSGGGIDLGGDGGTSSDSGGGCSSGDSGGCGSSCSGGCSSGCSS
jgi:hypothetical protein